MIWACLGHVLGHAVHKRALSNHLAAQIFASVGWHPDDFGDDQLHFGILVELISSLVIYEPVIQLVQTHESASVSVGNFNHACSPFEREDLVLAIRRKVLGIMVTDSGEVKVLAEVLEAHPESAAFGIAL